MARVRRTQSLPRHTVLAPTGRRIGAFFIDLAMTVLMTIILYFSASRFIFNAPINERQNKLFRYDFTSHLFKYDEKTQTRQAYKEEGNFQIYLDVLSYYYLHYCTGENIEVPEGYAADIELLKAPNYKEYVSGTETLPKDYYTVQWFNENVLLINDHSDDDNSTSYFKYDTTDGVVDKNKIGVRRDKHYSTKQGKVVEVTAGETAAVLDTYYRSAYFNHLMKQNFYLPLYNEVSLFTGISWLIPAIIACFIAYFIIPYFLANKATVGKKIFKLGLCGFDGYACGKLVLLMRVIPVILTLALIFLLPVSSYYICFAIAVVMLMISGGLAVSSPKRASLHDYCAKTLVIDAKSSIIFIDEIDEDEFLKAEDGEIEQ